MPEEQISYQRFVLKLDTARQSKRFEIHGDFILLQDLDDEAEIDLQLQHRANDIIELDKIRRIDATFNKFFITNTAQAGKTAVLLIGADLSFKADPLSLHKAHIRRDSQRAVLFDDVPLSGGGLISHYRIDVAGYEGFAFLISTTQNSTIYLQYSNDNINWYDLKSTADGDRSWNCNNEKICVMADIIAKYVRILVHDISGSAGTVRAEFIARY